MARRLSLTLVLQLLVFMTSMVGNLVITRILGPESRGILAVLNSGMLVLVYITNLSFGTAALVFTAKRSVPVGRSVGAALLMAGAVTTCVVAMHVLFPDLLGRTV